MSTKNYRSPLKKMIYTLIGLLGMLLVLLMLFIYFGLSPLLTAYKSELEVWVSDRLGSPVSIAEISTTKSNLFPQIKFTGIQVTNPDGSLGLEVKEASIKLSSKALLALQLRFSEISLHQPKVYMQRQQNGDIWVAGLDLTALTAQKKVQDSDGKIPKGLLWLLRQPKINLYNGEVQWFDAQSDAPQVELKEVTGVLLTQGRKHTIQVQATPLETWGKPFAVNTSLTEPAFSSIEDLFNWDATLDFSFPYIDIQMLPRHIELPIQLTKGSGMLIGSGEFKDGELIRSQATVDIPEVEMQIRHELDPIHLYNFSGTLKGSWKEQFFLLETDDLFFQVEPLEAQQVPRPWSTGSIRLGWRFGDEGKLDGGLLQTEEIELDELYPFVKGLPLPEATQKLLLEINPKGQVNFLDLYWEGSPTLPQTYHFKGAIEEFEATASVAPAVPAGKKMRMGRPGVKNLSLTFDLNQLGGSIEAKIQNGSITLPGLFDYKTVAVQQLDSSFQVKQNLNQKEIFVDAQKFELQTEDASLTLNELSWESPNPLDKNDPIGYFKLYGELKDAQAKAVHRYLPNSIQTKVRKYLEESLVSGQAPHATVKIDGPLADFPYHERESGIFVIEGEAKNATFDFVPPSVLPAGRQPWPVLTHVNGQLKITGKGIWIRNASGKILGAPQSSFKSKEVSIPDWSRKNTHVLVTAEIAGSGEQILNVVNGSTIGQDILKGLLEPAHISDQIHSTLNLDIHLDAMENTQVAGLIQLKGNTVSLWPFVPELQQANGEIHFSEKGFQLPKLQAHTLGGTVTGQAAFDLQKGLDIDLQGTLTAEGLFSDKNLAPKLLPSFAWLKGQTTYSFKAENQNGQPLMWLASDLHGLQIDLPAPLNKPAEDHYPLLVTMRPLHQGGRMLPLSLKTSLTPPANTMLPRVEGQHLLSAQGKGITVKQGSMGINQSPQMPVAGTSAQIRLDQINLSEWIERFTPATKSGQKITDLALPAWWPDDLQLLLGELQWGKSFQVDELQLAMKRWQSNWHAQLLSDQIAGTVEWRAPRLALGTLDINLAHLRLPDLLSNTISNTDEEADEPPQSSSIEALPNMNLVIDQVTLGERQLGSFSLHAQTHDSVWAINEVVLSAPGATLKGTGAWQNKPAQQTHLDIDLQIQNAGKFLMALGYKELIADGDGSLSGSINWQGLPYQPKSSTLSGDLDLSLQTGSLLFADPGAARLLNVLSLQALPSRLTLDFRDLTADGFAFNTIDGSFSLDRGLMDVKQLELKGRGAEIEVFGEVNLKNKTQQLQARLTPKIDMTAASAVLTVVNPAAGIGSLVAQIALRDPIQNATTKTFHIEGSWDAPKVTDAAQKTKRPEDKNFIEQIFSR